MGSHLSTPETLMVAADEIEATCPVCLRQGMIRFGWVDSHCSLCNCYSSESLNRTVRQRREYLGLTVQQMADRAGVSVSTVRQYERRWPSRKYWEQTKSIVAAEAT